MKYSWTCSVTPTQSIYQNVPEYAQGPTEHHKHICMAFFSSLYAPPPPILISALMLCCGVHDLVLHFVCFVIRSQPPS